MGMSRLVCLVAVWGLWLYRRYLSSESRYHFPRCVGPEQRGSSFRQSPEREGFPWSGTVAISGVVPRPAGEGALRMGWVVVGRRTDVWDRAWLGPPQGSLPGTVFSGLRSHPGPGLGCL